MSLRALIVDDSAIYRKIVREVLKDVSAITELFTAPDGEAGLKVLQRQKLDVVFLDVEMPKMDGIQLLKEIRKSYKDVDVVMISSTSQLGIDKTINALEIGAVAFIRKPEGTSFEHSIKILQDELKPVISTLINRFSARTARKVTSHIPPKPKAPVAKTPGGPSGVRKTMRPSRAPRGGFWATAIGVSTGGPEALGKLLPKLPSNYPLPIFIVQHMPKSFTALFAKHLNDKCALEVVEARAGDIPRAGVVYIAPGEKHLIVKMENGKPTIRTNNGPPENSVKPAVDVLFRSLAELDEKRPVLTAILTGMGYDGEKGVASLKASNQCYCVSQSEDTCVVYGMPRAVDDAGLSDESLKLEDIADRLVFLANRTGVRV
ncbi:MAG: chemotaxis-specific protein-glutamate methyltransferase CheB [bacterium]|nr:chemotaxis-specific protein-glutamate methyltransferase CheB [bacterium]